MSTQKPRSFISIAALSLVLLALFPSCKKDAGTGGLATIHGKVMTYNFDNDGVLVDSSYGGDIRVSISYGDHTWVDDDTRTSYTGDYAFEWLQKGDYKICVISYSQLLPLYQQLYKLDF